MVREPLDAWGVKVTEVQHEPGNRLVRSHKKAIQSLQAFRNRYLDVLVWQVLHIPGVQVGEFLVSHK